MSFTRLICSLFLPLPSEDEWSAWKHLKNTNRALSDRWVLCATSVAALGRQWRQSSCCHTSCSYWWSCRGSPGISPCPPPAPSILWINIKWFFLFFTLETFLLVIDVIKPSLLSISCLGISIKATFLYINFYIFYYYNVKTPQANRSFTSIIYTNYLAVHVTV